MAPPQTIAAPCQNASDSGARSSTVDSAADSSEHPLLGTVASAFGIAQVQSISEFFLSGSMAKVLTLSFIVVVLMFRPQGLFASKVRR